MTEMQQFIENLENNGAAYKCIPNIGFWDILTDGKHHYFSAYTHSRLFGV